MLFLFRLFSTSETFCEEGGEGCLLKILGKMLEKVFNSVSTFSKGSVAAMPFSRCGPWGGGPRGSGTPSSSTLFLGDGIVAD